MEKTKEGHARARRFIQIVAIAILLLCMAGGILAIQCFNGDRGLFGYSARIVMSSSMAGSDAGKESDVRDIPVRSLILIQLLPRDEAAREKFYSAIREGDVLTFSYRTIDGQVSVTHRVKKVVQSGDGFTFTLSGDNGNSAATQVIDTADTKSGNRIIGKVVFCSYMLGVTVCVLRDPIFLICVGIIVLSLLLGCALGRRRAAERAKGPPQRREK